MHEPHVFVALYAGQTIGEARIVGASTDPELVRFAADRIRTNSEAKQGTGSGRRRHCLATINALLRRLCCGRAVRHNGSGR